MPPEASQGETIATVTLNPAMDFTVTLGRLEPGDRKSVV